MKSEEDERCSELDKCGGNIPARVISIYGNDHSTSLSFWIGLDTKRMLSQNGHNLYQALTKNSY